MAEPATAGTKPLEEMSPTEPEPHEVLISAETLVYILRGVAVATSAPEELILELEKNVWSVQNDQRDPPGPPLSPSSWQAQLQTLPPPHTTAIHPLLATALAVSWLREISRRDIATSPATLSSIWTLVRSAILHTPHSAPFRFTPTRSAQGFLAVALCSIVAGGKIGELWRFHAWLPDGQRGKGEVAVHAHGPWARSWVVVGGGGADERFAVERVEGNGEGEGEGEGAAATHALYELTYNAPAPAPAPAAPAGPGPGPGPGQGTKAYLTHQLSSTITNTGVLVRATGSPPTVYNRDDSYVVPAGTYHRSVVPERRLHATLFVFDSSRGYAEGVGVLGPKDGTESTQVRDAEGVSAEMLVGIVDVAREGGGEEEVMSCYRAFQRRRG